MAMVNQPHSLNTVTLGLIIGISFPLISFLLYFLFRFQSTDFSGYIKFLVESKKLLHVISLSVLPNLLPFFLFLNSSRFRAGRGVLGATIGLAVLIFIVKFL